MDSQLNELSKSNVLMQLTLHSIIAKENKMTEEEKSEYLSKQKFICSMDTINFIMQQALADNNAANQKYLELEKKYNELMAKQ